MLGKLTEFLYFICPPLYTLLLFPCFVSVGVDGSISEWILCISLTVNENADPDVRR